jgi:hypothetical protein
MQLARSVLAGTNIDSAAAGLSASVNRFLERGARIVGLDAQRAVILDIENGLSPPQTPAQYDQCY